jgi:hypothetical protein
MRLTAAALALLIVAATQASADGAPRRKWRLPPYAYAGISYNLITPYYVGYFPTRYNHYRPDPIPSGMSYGPRLYRDGCWFAYDGVIWRAC